jgi:hypothetical protein
MCECVTLSAAKGLARYICPYGWPDEFGNLHDHARGVGLTVALHRQKEETT